MTVTTAMVKELRERTNAGVKECKDILTETGGDIHKAIEILRERGIEAAEKKQSREAREGRIEVYMHQGSRLAAMVEVNCETDFVANNDAFVALCRDLAMHIAATSPRYMTTEEVSTEEVQESGLEADKYYEQHVLMKQPFIKDASISVEDKVKEHIAMIGENIVIRRFARYEVGD